MPPEVLARDIHPAPARQPHVPGGVRVVSRNGGLCLDIVTSPSSEYLLPDLADFSLMKREATRLGLGTVLLCGPNVVFNDLPAGAPGLANLKSLMTPSSSIGSSWCSFPFEGGGFETGKPSTSPYVTGSFATSTPVRGLADLDFGYVAPKRRRRPDPVTVRRTTPVPSGQLLADASIASISSRIATLTDLSDEMLGRLFKVERETFCRWRSGALANPRLANRRRLGLLLDLVEELNARDVEIKDWLLNQTATEGASPYELLAQGRLDKVALLAASVGSDTGVERIQDGLEPLEFGPDDVWELDESDL